MAARPETEKRIYLHIGIGCASLSIIVACVLSRFLSDEAAGLVCCGVLIIGMCALLYHYALQKAYILVVYLISVLMMLFAALLPESIREQVGSVGALLFVGSILSFLALCLYRLVSSGAGTKQASA
jgi:hypothetical protein